MRSLHGTDLKRFLRDYRRQHQATLPKLAFLLQSVEYPANVGSAFRIADACHVEHMALTGITPCPPQPTLDKVARGKQNSVNWWYEEQPTQAIAHLRDEGYLICAIELTAEAQPYFTVDYPQRVCLVVGHEDHGVTRETLDHCDTSIFLPMYGKGRSLNVHVALGIVAYHILHR